MNITTLLTTTPTKNNFKIKIIALFLFLGLINNVAAQSFRTPTFTGALADFNSAERFAAAANNTTYAITFDATYMYIGAFRTSGTFGSGDNLAIYIDTDPRNTLTSGNGTSAGRTFNGVTPTLAFNADYTSYTEQSYTDPLNRHNGSWASTGVTPTSFTNTTSREVRIALADIGNPASVYVSLFMGYSGGIYSSAPGTDVAASGTPNMTGYFGSFPVYKAGITPVSFRSQNTSAANGGGTAISNLTIASTGTITAGDYGDVTILGAAAVIGTLGGNTSVTGTLSVGTGSTNRLNLGSNTLFVGGRGIGGSAGQLSINGSSGTPIDTSSNGTISFLGNGLVSGTASNSTVDIIPTGTTFITAGALDLGSVGGATRKSGINGTLQINPGGSIITNAPNYQSGSSLIYNTGGTYGAGTEWTSNSATAQGVPSAVTLQNNTALNFGASNQYRQARGLVTIGSGSGLTLSSAAGGDLRIAAGLTNNNAGSGVGFNTNGRALQTMGTGTYTKNGATGGTDNLDYLIIGSANQFTIADKTNLNLTNATGSCLQFNANGPIFMGGTNTLSIVAGGTVGGSSIGGIGGSGATTSVLSLLGNTNWSPGGVITVSTGVGLQVNGGLTNTTATRLNAGYLQINPGGFVSTNPIVYPASSTLVYNHSTGTYGVGVNEWPSASGPVNVTLLNNGGTGVSFGTNNITARTITGTLTLNTNQNLSLTGSGTPNLTVLNTIASANSVISGTGNYTQSASGSFTTANTSGVNGTLTSSGTITLPTTTSFSFNNSTASQATGSLMPSTIQNLTINNPTAATGTTIGSNTLLINGTTTLTAGALVLPTGAGNLVTFTNAIGGTTGTLTGSSTSNITTNSLNGTFNLGFTAGGQALNNWTLGSSQFGSSATNGLATPVSISGTFTQPSINSDFYSTSTGAMTILSGATYDEQSNAWYKGAGSLNINSGATFKINAPSGLFATSATGAVQTTGTRTFSGGANYTFNTAGGQTIGDALDATGGTGKTGVITGNVVVNGSATNLTLNTGTTITINTPGSFTLGSVTSAATLTAPATSLINGSGNVTFLGNGATTGSTLVTAHANGVNGTFPGTGTFSLTNGANNNTNFTFNGSVAQTTGALLPATVNSLNFSNTFSGALATPSVTLSSSVTVNGTTTNTGTSPTGVVSIGAGNTLTANGAITTTANKFIGTATSNLIIGGTGAISAVGLFLSGGGALNDFTMNRSGITTTIGTPLTVSGTYSSTAGVIAMSNNTLTLNGNIAFGAATLTATGPFAIGGSGTITGSLLGTNNPLALSGITMNRTSAALSLGSNVTVSNATGVTLTAGNINLGTFNLTNTNTSGTLGTGSSGSMIVATGSGQAFLSSATGAATKTFPIGDGTNYSPATLTFSANSVAGTVGARVTDGTHPQYNNSGTQTDYLSRYWSFTTTGLTNYTYTSTFGYPSADINGTEANIKLNRWNGSAWTEDATSTAASNVLTSTTGITNSTYPLNGNDFTGRLEITATTYVWNGSTSNDWATAANWTPSGPPGTLDNVTINVTGSFTNASINSGSKTINNLILNGTGAFAMTTGTALTINGNLTYGGTATAVLDCSSTLNIASSAAQTVPALNYGNLNIAGGARTLAASGTIGICGTYTPTGGAATISGSTLNFNSSGSQTIPALFYNNLSTSNVGQRTLSGSVNVAGIFAPGSNLYTVTGSTVTLSATSGIIPVTLPVVSSGNSFNILTINGSGGTFVLPYAATTQNLATTLNVTAGTFVLNPASSNLPNTVSVGTININGGTLDDASTVTGLSTSLLVNTAWNHTSGIVTNNSANGLDKIVFTGGGATTFNGISSGNFAYFSVQVSNNTTTTLNNAMSINGFGSSATAVTVDAGSTLNAGNSIVSSVILAGISAGFVINGTFITSRTAGFSGTTLTALDTVTNTPSVTLGSASTIEYNATGASPLISGRTDYANVTVSGSSTAFTFGGTSTLSGNYTQSAGTVGLTATTTARNLNVGGNFVMTGGTFNLVAISTATASTTVTVTGNTTTSGASSINLESTSNANPNGLGIFQTTDFTTTSTSTNIIDIGSGTYTGNEFRISGNFDKSGSGTFNIASITNLVGGIVFNKAGTQTFSYAGVASSYSRYYINSGSTVQMNTGVVLGNSTVPYSIFTVNSGGTIDMGTSVISGGVVTANANNTGFTLASGATMKTANTAGITGSITDLANTTTSAPTNYNAAANYEFNGSVAQNTNFPAATPTMNNLTINNSTANVKINKSINVNGNVIMTSGNLDLNGSFNISLGSSSSITGETNATRILNSGSPTAGNGFIGGIFTLGVNPGNVANLGMDISVASAMGNTEIRRYAKAVSSIPTSLTSISRIYYINATTGATNANVTYNYFENELNGNTETPVLVPYRSTNANETLGANYAFTAATASDGTTNTVSQTYTIPSGGNNFITLLNNSQYYTIATGDWNTNATWLGNTVPPNSSNATVVHAVTVNATVTPTPNTVLIGTGGGLTFGSSGNLTVNTTLTNGASGIVMTSGGTLNIGAGGTFANGSNTFTSGTGTVAFAGIGTVSGTITFNKATLAGAVDFGSSSTIGAAGSLQIDANGAVNTNAPTYNATSTLIYNSGGSYVRNTEWSAASGKGYPGNVTVQNGTTLSIGNPGIDLPIQGNLTLGVTGSAGSITHQNGNKLIIPGNVVIGSNTGTSTLALSSTNGGDIKVGGNWTRTANGAFTPNVRAVFFTGSGTNIINGNGGETYDYLLSEKTAGSIQLASNLTVNAPNTGNAMSLNSTHTFDLNGNNLNLTNGAATNIQVSGGDVNFSGTGTINISGGAKTITSASSGKAIFGNNVAIVTSGNIDFGSGVSSVNGTLQLNSGSFVSNFGPIYGTSSTLIYNTSGSYNRNVEWGSATPGAEGYPNNVTIINGTTLNLANPPAGARGLRANLNLGNSASSGSLLMDNMADTLTVGGNVTIGAAGGPATSTLSLSTNFGGDIIVFGNWTRNANGVFTPNTRAVFFEGTSNSTITTNTTANFDYLIINKTSGGLVTLANAMDVNSNLTLASGAVLNLGAFGSSAATLTTGGSVRATGTSYGGGANSPAAVVDATYFNNTAGYLNVPSCTPYSLSNTSNSAVCIASSSTVNVTASAANLPIGVYTINYTLSGANSGTFTAPMTVTTAGSGSFSTASLAVGGTTNITINFLTNGCVSKLTANNTATISINTATYNASLYSGNTPANWSEAPTATKAIVIANTFSSTGDVSGCSCTINPGVTATFNTGHTLTLSNAITNNGGTITFENGSSLLQTVGTNNTNSGNVIYKRDTAVMSNNYDFTYWSAPVAGQTLGSIWMSVNSADTFYKWNGTNSNWTPQIAANTMDAGVGYIARSRNGGSGTDYSGTYSYTTGNPWTSRFQGVPNNGNIDFIVSGTGANTDNLMGNPYPSALDLNLFRNDATNVGKLSGNFLFWTHTTAISGNVYVASDYAIWNTTLNAGVGGGTNATGSVITPTQFVPAGQSFFADGISNGTATFKNSHRVAGSNTAFYRTNETAAVQGDLESSKIWLNLTNTQGLFKQQLITYTQGATMGYDPTLDAKTFDGNTYIDFYSNAAASQFTIQSRALPFVNTDLVPLGFKTSVAGTYKIAIDHKDGLFDSQTVYLQDNLLNIDHNLSLAPYSFNTVTGTFNSRFVLKYTSVTLGNNNPLTENNNVIVAKVDNSIKIKSIGQNIDKIIVFDLLGRKVFEQNQINNKMFETKNVVLNQQTLIVKVVLEDGVVIAKKIVF